jgi:hypothetical protein
MKYLVEVEKSFVFKTTLEVSAASEDEASEKAGKIAKETVGEKCALDWELESDDHDVVSVAEAEDEEDEEELEESDDDQNERDSE